MAATLAISAFVMVDESDGDDAGIPLMGVAPRQVMDQLLMGVSENVVYPIVPNGFADHYPYEKWLAIIGNIPYFQRNPYL